MASSGLASAPQALTRGEPFFVIMASALLIIVVAGFAGVQISPNGFETRPITALVAVHALSQIAWFGLLIAQPYFVRTRQMKLHMTLGTMSLVVAGMVVITGYLVFRGAFADPD